MKYKKDDTKEIILSEDNLLRIFSLPSALIAPVYVFIMLKLHPETLMVQKWLYLSIAFLFVLLFLLQYFSSFFRKHIRFFYHAVYNYASAVTVYYAYLSNFSEVYYLTLMMIIFYICLTFEKMGALLYYFITTLIFVGLALYLNMTKNLYNSDGIIFLECLIILGAATILLRYTRNKDLKALYRMANYDPITGLPNRYYLTNHLTDNLNSSMADKKSAALMFIDLDKFKIINDTLGHSFGDKVLMQASQKMRDCLSEGDFIARYGGDEFIIILEDADQNRAERMAKQFTQSFSKPLYIKGHTIDITTSIGISLFPDDTDNPDTLIKFADIAMYYGKSRGRNQYIIYKKEMSEGVARKLEIEKGLRNAVQNNELIIYYQPEIEFETGKIVSAEALLRWHHPILGMVPPHEFIPIAEENGLIIPIGEWVLKNVCKQNKEWQNIGLPQINMAVNVSYQQVKNSNFIITIKEALNESGLNPQNLELEITESVLREAEELKTILDKLKPIGIRLSIDDFGVGYSSLSILQHVVINNLKIDMSFIKEIPNNPKASSMVKTIIEMGRNLSCRITAEGVETVEQALFLKMNRCSYGQGYFFSHPLSGADFEKLLKDWKSVNYNR